MSETCYGENSMRRTEDAMTVVVNHLVSGAIWLNERYVSTEFTHVASNNDPTKGVNALLGIGRASGFRFSLLW